MLWVVGRLLRKNLVLDGCDEFTDRETPRVFWIFALGIVPVLQGRRDRAIRERALGSLDAREWWGRGVAR